MEHLQGNINSIEVASKEQAFREELELLEEQEQIHWHQKSRVSWFVEGDKNTKFFQAIRHGATTPALGACALDRIIGKNKPTPVRQSPHKT